MGEDGIIGFELTRFTDVGSYYGVDARRDRRARYPDLEVNTGPITSRDLGTVEHGDFAFQIGADAARARFIKKWLVFHRLH